MAFIAMFADQGIATALVQRLNLKLEHVDAAYWFRYGEALTRECSRFTAESIPLSCRTGRLTLQGSAHSGLL